MQAALGRWFEHMETALTKRRAAAGRRSQLSRSTVPNRSGQAWAAMSGVRGYPVGAFGHLGRQPLISVPSGVTTNHTPPWPCPFVSPAAASPEKV